MESLIGNARRPDVSIYCNGRIDITARVAKLLDLDQGDVIDISHQSGEYYIHIRHRASEVTGRYEATCYRTKHKSHNYRAYSKRLTSAILTLCKTNKALLAIGIPVTDTKGETIVPLITRNPL